MSRSPRCRPVTVAGVLVTLLLPISAMGCGVTNDEKTAGTTTTPSTTEPEAARAPVEEWGADVCEALTAWSDGFDQIGEDFDTDLESVDEGDVATVRDLLADLFGQAADHTHDLGDRLEELGAPDIERGDEIATEIRKGISKVQGELTDLKNQVSDLAIDDPAEFSDEVDRLNEDFQASLDEISAALDNFEAEYGEAGAKLDEVLNSDDACADVGA
jgi:hypothetical protein